MGDDRVHVVGIGSVGWDVVRAIHDAEPECVSLYGYCSRRGVLRVEDAWESATSIADADIARQSARQVAKQIVDELSNAAIIVLIGSLLDATTAGVAPVVAHALGSTGACVVAVVAQGDTATARLAARCLAESTVSVIAIDTELARATYIDSIAEDPETTEDVVRALLINASLTIAEQGGLGIDHDTLATVIRTTERRTGRFAAASAAGNDRAKHATRAAFEALPGRAKDFASTFIIRVASDGRFRFRETTDALEVIEGLAPPRTACIALGAAIHESLCERLEVGIVALGVE